MSARRSVERIRNLARVIRNYTFYLHHFLTPADREMIIMTLDMVENEMVKLKDNPGENVVKSLGKAVADFKAALLVVGNNFNRSEFEKKTFFNAVRNFFRAVNMATVEQSGLEVSEDWLVEEESKRGGGGRSQEIPVEVEVL